MKESQSEFEAGLKTAHKHVGRITLSDGSYIYFRRPTVAEHAEFQSLAVGDDDGGRTVAFARYVRICFAGHYPDGLPFDALVEQEGPASVSGPWGNLVNRLAGVADRPTAIL